MARLFTKAEALASGLSYEAIRWGVDSGAYVRLALGVYFEAARPPVDFERRLATAMRLGKPVEGELSAALHGFDGFEAPQDGCYSNVPRSGVRDTLIAIASTTTDLKWEWAMEWALRKQHVTVDDLDEELLTHRRGNGRIRRVMKLRPKLASPTESLLETLMVQLIRTDPSISTPARQVEVRNAYGEFVARVDLAWPLHGVFLELDGEHHRDQPVYDASRQTRVVASTGWLVGRFTWTEVTRNQRTTMRRLMSLLEMAQVRRAS